MKFTERGSVRIELRTRVVDDGMVAIAISIHDTGIGMNPEQIARLGEAFTQADSPRPRRFGGTGLGMTISKALIHLMDGSIDVESQPGAGSVFSVHLRMPGRPGRKTGEDGRRRQSDSGRGACFHPCWEKVLVAEDNTINQLVMQGMLRSHAKRIDLVGNGALAVEAVAGERYDCVLMDCQMPEMDGY